ncbi:putative phage glucose translocase [Pseudomonas fluorescens]|uniref:Putative phage glucose translocase n=1 Tax=Pseudomonas fluorescens TaxID=294 RepID=A0A0P8ZMJ3_PSEFL|nr:hypothetical protein [Pseudomonas fluorescens]KPU58378.1 putative phage glucose translocase [Pseudomonas fluorescens]
MRLLWKGLSSYTVIGVANTLIHWQIFFPLSLVFGFLYSRYVVFRERDQ